MPASAAASIRACPISFGSAYGTAADVVVQVVEFADRGDARQRHLGVHRAGQRPVAVGVEPVGRPVHQVAPRPERPAVALGAASAAPGERRASGRWPGRVSPARAGVSSRRAAAALGSDRRDPAVVDGDRAPVGDGVAAQPGVFTPPVARGHRETQSAITSASASAPTLQSAISAYSSGECETPVGLRTNSIAVGTFADRMPASWPACGRQHRDVAEPGQCAFAAGPAALRGTRTIGVIGFGDDVER